MLASAQLGAPETLTDSEGIPPPRFPLPDRCRSNHLLVLFATSAGFAFVFPSTFEKSVRGHIDAVVLCLCCCRPVQRSFKRAFTCCMCPSPMRQVYPIPLPASKLPCYTFFTPILAGIFRDVSASFWVQPGRECQVSPQI
jgi:hypothetical protein